jgi:PHD/YefM family antitoxin component YafN of YafNO toxin-antitoxin module
MTPGRITFAEAEQNFDDVMARVTADQLPLQVDFAGGEGVVLIPESLWASVQSRLAMPATSATK